MIINDKSIQLKKVKLCVRARVCAHYMCVHDGDWRTIMGAGSFLPYGFKGSTSSHQI